MVNEKYCVKCLGIKCTLSSTLRKFRFSAVGINEEGPVAPLKWYLFVCITNSFQQIYRKFIIIMPYDMNTWPTNQIFRAQCNPNGTFPFK